MIGDIGEEGWGVGVVVGQGIGRWAGGLYYLYIRPQGGFYHARCFYYSLVDSFLKFQDNGL